ncbi:MAG: UpxY family transcription antiterminator [Terriglobia bacterium]
MATGELTGTGSATAYLGVDTAVVEARWFALQTRARHEKKVDTQLHEKGIECFLPLSKEMHQWSDRQRMVQQPLFTGYVFVHIADAQPLRRSVLRTPGVCWFVGNRGMGLPIPDKQIEDIQTLLSSAVPFTLFPFVRIGQRVRIRGGCLDGIEGVLISKDADRTVVVSVELVRRSLAVSINGYDLEEA